MSFNFEVPVNISIKKEKEDAPDDNCIDVEPDTLLDVVLNEEDGDPEDVPVSPDAILDVVIKEEPDMKTPGNVHDDIYDSTNSGMGWQESEWDGVSETFLGHKYMEDNENYDANCGDDESGPGRVPCSLCTKTFKDERGLRSHIQTHTADKPHPCPACGKPFKVKAYLRQHKKYCSMNETSIANRADEKQCVCPICQKAFVTNVQLRRHIQTHSDDRPFTCPICAKKYKFRAYLRSHMMCHSNEKRHSCEICGKTFKQKGNLRRHKKFCGIGRPPVIINKETERNFPCDVCGKKFLSRDQLKIHLTIHSDERPYGCDYCGKSFKLKSILKKHILAHVTIFDCKKCGTVFNRPLYLRKHIPICGIKNLKPPPERPFTCNVCPHRYTTKRRLEKHLLKHAIKVERIDDYNYESQSSESSWQQPPKPHEVPASVGMLDGMPIPIMEIKVEPVDEVETLYSEQSLQNSLQEWPTSEESNLHRSNINDKVEAPCSEQSRQCSLDERQTAMEANHDDVINDKVITPSSEQSRMNSQQDRKNSLESNRHDRDKAPCSEQSWQNSLQERQTSVESNPHDGVINDRVISSLNES